MVRIFSTVVPSNLHKPFQTGVNSSTEIVVVNITYSLRSPFLHYLIFRLLLMLEILISSFKSSTIVLSDDKFCSYLSGCTQSVSSGDAHLCHSVNGLVLVSEDSKFCAYLSNKKLAFINQFTIRRFIV